MIHQYKNNGYNIIIDANSGCIHSVDDVAYDIIKLVDEGIGDAQSIFKAIKDNYNDITIDDVTETLEDIELLKKEGKLFSDDIFRDLAPYMKDKQSVLKAICLHVAHDCNMNCGYCFAGTRLPDRLLRRGRPVRLGRGRRTVERFVPADGKGRVA